MRHTAGNKEMESPTNVVQHVNVTPGFEKKQSIPESIEHPNDYIYTFERDASKTKYVSITSKQNKKKNAAVQWFKANKDKKKLTVRYLLKVLVEKH